ncbi:MAG: diadenylate cyclase CdaA [Clostridia bacterium]|nr:TIGR00159 family protein [Oscillospiraceae bacterium]MBQ7032739.1 diadenylate cyclase CdaA [Clostridia bacterium]
MRPADFVDIIIVAFALYKGVKLVRETRAQQLVKAVVILILILWGSTLLRLHSITYILENVMQVGFLALLIIFQPELRRMLEKVGRSKIGNIFTSAPENIDRMVDELADAATYLSAHKIGALVVLERGTKIGEIVTTGTALSADLTSALLINIFIPNTPLHDGAVVIQEGRISAAGCLLPLTQNDSLSRELGTRHRAALGMTEISDAVVLVVSEETGKISIARDGDMVRNLTEDSLRRALYKNLAEEEAAKPVEELRKWKEAFRWKKK